MSDLQFNVFKFQYIRKPIVVLFACALWACSDSDDAVVKPSDDAQQPPTQAETYPRVRFTDCPFDTSVNTAEVRCGVLDTYENYELTGPDARTIEISFGIVPATITPAAPDPIVLFSGGPGASALAEFALGFELGSYSGNRDLILIDQRGAGFSNPFINCVFANDDLEIDALYEEIRVCIKDFEQQGVDLSQYRSAVIAQDYKELREALNIPQWNVYGVSYGPIPGILYADLDPGGVRSVIFDSSTDNQVDIALSDAAAPLDYITEAAIQCAAEVECAARMPDLRSVFIDTFRSLMSDPWTFDLPGGGEEQFEGYILFGMIEDLYPIEYPGVLEIFANRDEALWTQLFYSEGDDNNNEFRKKSDNVLFKAASDGSNKESRMVSDDVQRRAQEANLMGAVVQCAAYDVDNFDTAILPTKEQWPDDLIDAARELVAGGYHEFCNGGFVSIDQDLTQREPRLLDVPALILGGALDRIVPLTQVQKLTESFKSPYLAIDPKGGHGQAFPTVGIDSCAKGIVTAFLQNTGVAPDVSCLTMNDDTFIFDDALIDSFR